MTRKHWFIGIVATILVICGAIAWAVDDAAITRQSQGNPYYASAESTVDTDGMYFGTSTGVILGTPRSCQWLILTVASDALSDATLSAGTLQVQPHPDSAWQDYLAGADWDAASTNLPFCTTISPAEVAAGEESYAVVKLYGVHAWRFFADVAADTALITVQGRIVEQW